MKYRGRIAPTPTGYLHLGHARTFWIAQSRCNAAGGTLLYRNEDLDPNRCKPEFRATTLEDLRWLGLEWEGEPVNQSDRFHLLSDFPAPCNISTTTRHIVSIGEQSNDL